MFLCAALGYIIVLSCNLHFFWSYSENFKVLFVQQVNRCLEISDLAAHARSVVAIWIYMD